MNYVDYLKARQPLDSLIIELLYHGASISHVARVCGVSRQHVHNVIERSKQLLLEYELLDIST